jgi:hypothetical protein
MQRNPGCDVPTYMHALSRLVRVTLCAPFWNQAWCPTPMLGWASLSQPTRLASTKPDESRPRIPSSASDGRRIVPIRPRQLTWECEDCPQVGLTQ